MSGWLRRWLDRQPAQLDNERCADCIFSGSRLPSGEYHEWLYDPCDWHKRHPGPWGDWR